MFGKHDIYFLGKRLSVITMTSTISQKFIIEGLKSKLSRDPGKTLSIVEEIGIVEDKPHIKSIEVYVENEPKIKFVAKCLTKEFEANQQTLKNFQVECHMYAKVFPKLESMRQSANLEPLGIPKAYFTSMGLVSH